MQNTYLILTLVRKPSIGLEIHVELDTETKMFCACPNNPDERHPNVNVCPVCLGHPGTLPTINKKAVESVIKMGLALGGMVADRAHFDRKSYFYPDLPKGYQISQYDEPFIVGGELNGVRIRRIHLEEDTGRLIHATHQKSPYSLVDFNRAGIPLAELVTEPDITSADQAVAFAREFQLILRYLGISRADMEKGQMRIEANVSLSASRRMGTKVEVKNINSFRSVRDAILYELERQKKVLEENKEVVQETRGWVDDKRITKSQRIKESAHDYRYFPEPDLPPLNMAEFDIKKLETDLPELPKTKRERLKKEYGLSKESVNLLVEDKKTSGYFEEAASEFASRISNPDYEILFNCLTGDLRGLMNEAGIGFDELKITPERLAHFVGLVKTGELSSKLAKTVLADMFVSGKDPETIKREGDFELIDDESELRTVAERVITKNKKAVVDYRNGKEEALKFLVGQMMAQTGDRANPEESARILKAIL